MKVLVTYYSQTGNTEKIAKAILAEAAEENETEIAPLESIAAAEITGYDLIFIGSPLHSANLAAPVKDWLAALQANSCKKLAGFITHFAPGYPDQDMTKFTEPIKEACSDKGIEYLGSFDCQGALTEALHEMVQKKLNQTDEQWQETIRQMTGHPDQEDENKARVFAKKILA